MLLHFGKTTVGMFQTIGGPFARYHQQEDALISFASPEFVQLSGHEQTLILRKTIAKMQAEYGDPNKTNPEAEPYQGSTLNGTIAWQEDHQIKAVTANVGDSLSYLVVLDKNKNVKQMLQLNEEHNARHPNQEDAKRLKAINEKNITNKEGMELYHARNRLYLGNISLALTRAIGDNHFEPALSHDPEIKHNQFRLEEGETAFVVVASDGLTEKGLKLQQIAQIVAENHAEPETAAKALANKAIETRSSDNISVAVFAITPQPAAAFVFDGHGGNVVSYNLGNHFYAALTAELFFYIQNRPIQQQIKALTDSTDFATLTQFLQNNKGFFNQYLFKKYAYHVVSKAVDIINKMTPENYAESLARFDEFISQLAKENNSENILTLLQRIHHLMTGSLEQPQINNRLG